MALFLTNEDEERCVSAIEAVDAIEDGVRQFAVGDAIRRPRIDNFMPSPQGGEFFCFSSMEGTIRSPGYHALRIKPDMISWPVVEGRQRRVTYSTRPGLYGGLVLLFSVANAELLAIMNDGYVQHLRTAATGALGIRYMSNPRAEVMGLLGSGGMARTFAMTAKAVRPIRRIQVYSPNQAHLEAYCDEMRSTLSIDVVPFESAKAAMTDADIVSGCTNSMEAVITPDLVRPGVHITNVMLWEVSPEVYGLIDAVGVLARRTPMSVAGFVDDDFGMRMGVLSYAGGQSHERSKIPTPERREARYPNARIVDCCDWQTNQPYQRSRPDEITTLATASHGTLEGEGGGSAGIQGIQFACVAGRVYENAKKLGLGRELPADWFLQDIPT